MSGEMLPDLQTADQSQQPHQQWERVDWGRGQVWRDWWLRVYFIHPAASLSNYHCGEERDNISVLQSWQWWTYIFTPMIIFSVAETVFKCQYLRQILCILIYILMVLKLDNSSNCVDTSGKCDRQRSTFKCLGNINVCSVECVVWCPRCRLPLSHCPPP